MTARPPAVAGQFYPASPEQCRAQIEHCLAAARTHAAGQAAATAHCVGGIVPHAGWVCSGPVAAAVVAAVFAEPADTVVVFGAAHRRMNAPAAVYPTGSWETPLGEISMDEALAQAVLRATSLLTEDPDIHGMEHSIEVEVPFLQHLAPGVMLLPVLVMPSAAAHEVGRVVATEARAFGRRVVFLGSTDLTHYGPRYRFTPHGEGPAALEWAQRVNDRRMIELMINMRAEEVVEEAMTNRNACGSGAVAATIAACREAGATQGRLVWHTTSNEVLRDRYGEMDDAVGYAGVVFTAHAMQPDAGADDAHGRTDV